VRQKVLIVEDDHDLRRMFSTVLALAGFDTEEAQDAFHALHRLDQEKPTAIVLDLGLPRVSGHVVLQEVVAQAHLREIPVLIVTGQPGVELPDGAACLLRKPVMPDQLVSAVRRCILEGGASVKQLLR